MPRRDGTGPGGAGPRTGRRMGPCAPGQDDRIGPRDRGIGRGRRGGRGRGLGRGLGEIRREDI